MSEENINKLQLIERMLALPVYLVTLGAMLWFLNETQKNHREFVQGQQQYSRQLAESGHEAVNNLADNLRGLSANMEVMQKNIEKQNEILLRQVAILNATLPDRNLGAVDR